MCTVRDKEVASKGVLRGSAAPRPTAHLGLRNAVYSAHLALLPIAYGDVTMHGTVSHSFFTTALKVVRLFALHAGRASTGAVRAA